MNEHNDPTVAITILNWNNYEDTSKCLGSLEELKYSEYGIIVVDNGSIDGSTRRLKEEYPNVNIIKNDRNLGFAGGMNVGIEKALENGYDYVLLLNNDVTFPDKEALGKMVNKMEKNEDVGVLSPLVNKQPTGRSNVTNTVSSFRIGRTRLLNENLNYDNMAYNCHYCCALIPSEILESVGHLPEQYFLYYEDIHHGAEIEDAGYWLATDITTYVYHEENATTGSNHDSLISYYVTRNRLLFCRNRLSSFILMIWFLLYLFQTTGTFLKQFLMGNGKGAKATILGLIDGLRRKNGRGPFPESQ